MLNLEPSATWSCAAEALGASQRRSRRHLCIDGSVMRLAVRPEFRGRLAILVDVSVTGIGLVLQDALETGAMLVFELKGSVGAGPISRIARVRRCERQATPPEAPWLKQTPRVLQIFRSLFGMKPPPPPGDSWLVGCEFDRPMDEIILAQFLASLKGDPDGDDSFKAAG